MTAGPVQEFHYRLPRRTAGWRPGSHSATSLGAGGELVSHMRLYDRPDPRRLDLRASLRDVRGDWLIRVSRQRGAVNVYVLVDVSASMGFGSQRPKVHVIADFVESLGLSAWRAGDLQSLVAFDSDVREDLLVPPQAGRAIGSLMAGLLRQCVCRSERADGVEAAALRIAGRDGLVFLASDFHWPAGLLERTLDRLAHACVVPMVVWDPAEVHPPSRDGLLILRDAESQATRALWIRPGLRRRWLEAVERRRAELETTLLRRGIRPFYVEGEFDHEAMSRYFLEAAA